jgi:hypothetical protein
MAAFFVSGRPESTIILRYPFWGPEDPQETSSRKTAP